MSRLDAIAGGTHTAHDGTALDSCCTDDSHLARALDEFAASFGEWPPFRKLNDINRSSWQKRLLGFLHHLFISDNENGAAASSSALSAPAVDHSTQIQEVTAFDKSSVPARAPAASASQPCSQGGCLERQRSACR